jgi:RNA recognition motif-containing protein
MNIYVGNIAFSMTEDDLRQAFEAYGEVSRATILKDKMTNRSRGFGFVEMPNQEEGQKAVQELNGKEMNGRALNVSEARPRTEGNRDNRNPMR